MQIFLLAPTRSMAEVMDITNPVNLDKVTSSSIKDCSVTSYSKKLIDSE